MNRKILIIVGMCLLPGLQGCVESALSALNHRKEVPPSSSADLHEKIVYNVRKQGFASELKVIRETALDFDTITIRIPLDAIKRRHYSLENLLKMVGRTVATSKRPAQLTVYGQAEDDQDYMKGIFIQELSGVDNVTLNSLSATYTGIVIFLSHPSSPNKAPVRGDE